VAAEAQQGGTGAPGLPKRTWAEKDGRSPPQLLLPANLASQVKAIETYHFRPTYAEATRISCTSLYPGLRVRLSVRKPHEVRERHQAQRETRGNLGHPSSSYWSLLRG
jgi:hypothetical protein